MKTASERKEDGGAAFPRIGHQWKEKLPREVVYPTHYEAPLPGMSLRDYFAAAALPTLLEMESMGGRIYGDVGRKEAATHAYLIADALLKARQS